MRLPQIALGAAFLLVGQVASAQAPTVVIVVRHAERAPGSGDPPISDAGQARARALADVARAAGVSAVITTQLQRTRQTAAPLAESLGLTPIVVNTQSNIAGHAADVAAVVRQHTGKTVLVVGHSNTVPAIVAALGGPKVADLCEPEYDNVFTLVIDAAGGARTVRARYGAATPVDANCAAMR